MDTVPVQVMAPNMVPCSRPLRRKRLSEQVSLAPDNAMDGAVDNAPF